MFITETRSILNHDNREKGFISCYYAYREFSLQRLTDIFDYWNKRKRLRQ